jgi:hypothetical protein
MRVAVRVLEGIDHFLAACCKAQKELQSEKQRLAGDVCADCVEKLRPADGPQTETESAQQLTKKFDLPLTPGTLTRLLEVLFGAHLPLLAAEESLARAAASMEEQSAFEDKKMSEEAVRKAEQDYARSEHHAAELGGGVGGVMVRFCELAQLPTLVQVGLKAFVFFFGRCLVGKTVDRMMEPSIRDDVAALEQAARVAEACQSAPRVSSPEDAENRITAKLEKLMPPIPLAGTAPRQLSHALVQILGNDRLMRELVYFYIFPSLLVNL